MAEFDMPALQTDRLVLRRFEQGDAPAVLRALQEDDVARWIPLLPHPYGAAEAEGFVTLQAGPNHDALAVIHQDHFIGCMTIGVELGYWFAKTAWGQGFATEAAGAVADRYFAKGHDVLQSGYMRDNNRSRRVLEKLGFTDSETVVRHSEMLSADVTIQRMTLSRATWKARQ